MMTTNDVSKFDQYAVIALLAKFGKQANQRLGKKAMQKLVHLIQELGGVNVGYKFSFYTYGPYSSALAGDLDIVAALNGVTITYNATDNFYLIEPAAESDAIIEKGEHLLKGHKDSIDTVVNKFGRRLAKDLELVSTVVYLRRHESPEIFDRDDMLAERVKSLKPKFDDQEIRLAIKEVKEFLRESNRAF